MYIPQLDDPEKRKQAFADYRAAALAGRLYRDGYPSWEAINDAAQDAADRGNDPEVARGVARRYIKGIQCDEE